MLKRGRARRLVAPSRLGVVAESRRARAARHELRVVPHHEPVGDSQLRPEAPDRLPKPTVLRVELLPLLVGHRRRRRRSHRVRDGHRGGDGRRDRFLVHDRRVLVVVVVPVPVEVLEVLHPVPHVKIPDPGVRVRVRIRAIPPRPAAGPRPPSVHRPGRARASRPSRRRALKRETRKVFARADAGAQSGRRRGPNSRRTLDAVRRARTRPRVRPRHRRLNLRVHPSNVVHPRARAAGVVVADGVIGLPVVFAVVSIKILAPAAPSRRLSASVVAP